METLNRFNAVPLKEIALRCQFQKGGILADVFEVSKVEISLMDPRSSLYKKERDTLEVIEKDGVSKIAVGQYEYLVSSDTIKAVGTFYDIVSFKATEDGQELVLVNKFAVSETGVPKLGYVTVDEVRQEGLTDKTKFPDSLINSRINYHSRAIEHYTGLFFEPRKISMIVDGNGAFSQQLDVPIINIEKIQVLEPSLADYRRFDLQLSDAVIYNRHITMGLHEPDDRENPRLGNIYFPKGRQNIIIEGTFGYTERDLSTPVMIKRALILLVIKDRYLLASKKRKSLLSGMSGRVKSESTDGHSYSLATPTASAAQTPYYSGDEEVDHLLHGFKRPVALGKGLGGNAMNFSDSGFDYGGHYSSSNFEGV